MKRFQLFAFDDYYPRGGARDLMGEATTVEGAMEQLLSLDVSDQRLLAVPRSRSLCT